MAHFFAASLAFSCRHDARPRLSQNSTSAMARPKKTPLAPQKDAFSSAVARFSAESLATRDKLPCREAEFDNLLGIIVDAIREDQGLCIYLSGVPGTGKTATVKAVIKLLQKAAQNSEIEEFDFVEINAMALADPKDAYSLVADAVRPNQHRSPAAPPKRGRPAKTKASAAASKPIEALENHFRLSRPTRYTILLVDELDYMITRSQSVVYNFFEWPNCPHSRLIVVGIANTMDLPERIFSHKVASRLGMTRINFVPYTHQQLTKIVEFYLGAHAEVFSANAIELCARKVSAISGDVRRIMEIVKRALLIGSSRHSCEDAAGQRAALGTQISLSLVQQAISETFSASSASLLAGLSLHQKVFLAGIAVQSHRSGLSDVSVGCVVDFHRQICRSYGLLCPSADRFVALLASLEDMKVLFSDYKARPLSICKASLAVSFEDLRGALKTHEITKNLLAFD